jgi:uridine kinase
MKEVDLKKIKMIPLKGIFNLNLEKLKKHMHTKWFFEIKKKIQAEWYLLKKKQN